MKQISIRSAAAWLACLALSVTMTPMAAGAKEETVSASAAGTTPSAYQQYRADLDLPLASDRHELAAETAQTVEGGTPDNGALLIGDTGSQGRAVQRRVEIRVASGQRQPHRMRPAPERCVAI